MDPPPPPPKRINGHQYILEAMMNLTWCQVLQEITFDDEMVKTNADQKLLSLLTSYFMLAAFKQMDTEFDRMVLKAVMGFESCDRFLTMMNSIK